MVKTIIFHSGSAKTGSTTLQAHLMAMPSRLAQAKAFYCHRMVRSGDVDPLNFAVRDVRNERKRRKAVSNGRERLRHLFEDEGFDTVILSNESAIGDPFHDTKPGFFPLMHDALAGLQEMFEGYRVVPVFFVRSQATLLPSFYGQRIRQGASYDLKTFSSRALSFDLSWHPVVKAFQAAFPEEALELHKFEEFVAGPASYIDALFSKLLDMEPVEATAVISKNSAAKSHAVWLMRKLNAMAEGKGPAEHSETIKKRLRRTLFRLIEQLNTGQRLELAMADAEKLEQLYQADLSTF